MNTFLEALPPRATAVLLLLSALLLVVLIGVVPPPSPAAAGPRVQAAPHSAKEFYVDTASGLDSNPGTKSQPFRTIAKAVNMVGPGDYVILREGIYREPILVKKSGLADAPITIKAYKNERVTISGAARVMGWTGPDARGIYAGQVADNIDLNKENYQVFVNGRMVHQAREPEIGDHNDPFSQQWLETPMIKGVAVNIQAANGQYLQAEGRGGGAVNAGADSPGTWEEFYLIDTNGGDLVSGDKAGFLTNDHRHYLAAENGGRPGGADDNLVANRTEFGSWEKFTIANVASKKKIESGDRITLRAAKNGYLGADLTGGECGGGQVLANSQAIGNCEKFLITIRPESLVLFDEDAVDFDSSDDAWSGSYIWGPFGANWSLGMAKINASALGKLVLGDSDAWWNSWGWNQGNAAIIGGLSALDSENEWHFEKNSTGTGGKLYFKPPAGTDPDSLSIEIRKQTWAAEIEGSFIVISNIDFFAGQLKLVGSSNLLDNVSVLYGTHFVYRDTIGEESGAKEGNNGIYIVGNDNTVRNSEIAYSAGSGMVMQGDRNTVQNCLIHDFGYMGTYTSGVYFDGSDSTLTRSTLFNSGRDILHLGECIGCEITYNLMHDSTMLTDDSGVVYTFGRDLKGTRIAYNWIQGVTDPQREVGSIHLGIYLDNGSRNALVHHNVISGLANKPGVGPNTPHEGHLICNNTIIHDKAVDAEGNPINFDKIGEWAYCNCDFDRNSAFGNFYFEGLGECVHQRDGSGKLTGASWCANPDYQYWMTPKRLEVRNTQYYRSFSEAGLELINPQEVVTKENGWEITGSPDFRPQDGTALVDAGSMCAGADADYAGLAPDLGAYENNGTNWIPGYRRVHYRVPLGDPEGIISAGEYHTCALQPNGRADCWGAEQEKNDHGQAGDQVGPFVQVGAGAIHSCGLRTDGSVDCWGTKEWYGQGEDRTGPFSQLSVGGDHNCGLKPDGSVECWGGNWAGQADAQAGPFVQIGAGWDHSCGLGPDGTIDCWGSNELGQAEDKAGPFSQVSVGFAHTCGLRLTGSVECWGRNEDGQAEDQAGPFKQISAGGRHTCGLKPDGSVECWGFNSGGQAESKTGPFVQISAGGTWMAGPDRWGHTCGLKPGGSVECWGGNKDGQAQNQTGPYGQFDPSILIPLIMRN